MESKQHKIPAFFSLPEWTPLLNLLWSKPSRGSKKRVEETKYLTSAREFAPADVSSDKMVQTSMHTRN